MNALTVEGLGTRCRVGTRQVYDLWAQADLPFRPLPAPSLTRLQRPVLGE